MTSQGDQEVRTEGAPPDFTLTAHFIPTDYGVAYAELTLTTPSDGQGQFVQVTASGPMHSATTSGHQPISGRFNTEYKDARAAMAAALRFLGSDVERAWAKYAVEHGPGAR